MARASLDTVPARAPAQGHWLYTHPRVRLSPHIPWSMPDALERLYATFAANLRRHLPGEPLEGLVDPKRGY